MSQMMSSSLDFTTSPSAALELRNCTALAVVGLNQISYEYKLFLK